MEENEIIEIIEEKYKTLDVLLYKIITEFEVDDIHNFRVEVKKLKAFFHYRLEEHGW